MFPYPAYSAEIVTFTSQPCDALTKRRQQKYARKLHATYVRAKTILTNSSTLWPQNAGNKPTPRTDDLYYLHDLYYPYYLYDMYDYDMYDIYYLYDLYDLHDLDLPDRADIFLICTI